VLSAPHTGQLPPACRRCWLRRRLSATLGGRDGLRSCLRPLLLLLCLPRLELPPLALYMCLLYCLDPRPPLRLCALPRQLGLLLLLRLAHCLGSRCLLHFMSLFGSACLSTHPRINTKPHTECSLLTSFFLCTFACASSTFCRCSASTAFLATSLHSRSTNFTIAWASSSSESVTSSWSSASFQLHCSVGVGVLC